MARGRQERGQSAVELAVTLPLLMLILLGCLDLGRAFAVRLTLANGVREGARYACMFPEEDPDVLAAYAERDILAQGLDPNSLAVVVDAPQGVAGGNPVQVTAVYTLPMFTGYLFGGKPLVIKAQAEMMILGGY